MAARNQSSVPKERSSPLTADRLREHLHYDPETGLFTWLKCRRGTAVGSRAGGSVNGGYIRIGIDQIEYRAHRLAWLYVHGEWPTDEIDHMNGIRDDNRLANLRVATRSQNSANARRHVDGASGLKGAHFHKRWKTWRAEIMVDGKHIFLGAFETREEAHAAYAKAAADLCGEFARAS